MAKSTFAAVHAAIMAGLVRSCHDLSEGGLAVAAVEMAMAGGLGMAIDIDAACGKKLSPTEVLFSESNTRFIVEVEASSADAFAKCFAGVPLTKIGTITDDGDLVVRCENDVVLQVSTSAAKSAWQKPLAW